MGLDEHEEEEALDDHGWGVAEELPGFGPEKGACGDEKQDYEADAAGGDALGAEEVADGA